MSIYVDPLLPCVVRPRWRWPAESHLVADGYDELHRFAARIGLSHKCFQHGGPSISCYCLNESTRRRAVIAGAIELDRPAMAERLGRSRQLQGVPT